MELNGVGEKVDERLYPYLCLTHPTDTLHSVLLQVADCVALFSLDKIDSIPVDTHVWQIAVRDLDPTLSEKKSLTHTVYTRVRGYNIQPCYEIY